MHLMDEVRDISLGIGDQDRLAFALLGFDEFSRGFRSGLVEGVATEKSLPDLADVGIVAAELSRSCGNSLPDDQRATGLDELFELLQHVAADRRHAWQDDNRKL